MRTEQPDTWDSEAGLRDALRRLPTPETTPSAFDARVLAALRRPRQLWWQTLLGEARPLLAGAACSCVVMSAALSWSLKTPSPQPAPSAGPSLAARPLDMAGLDRLLDRPGLSAASLVGVATPHGPIAPPGASRPSPSPPQRATLRSAPMLV